MKHRFTVAPQAARDLVNIWRYVARESTRESADRVESVIRSKFSYLAGFPGGGHWRRGRTSSDLRFFCVYPYLIVYRPETKPLQIVAILHSHRDVATLLIKRV